MFLIHHPEVAFLGIYHREMKTQQTDCGIHTLGYNSVVKRNGQLVCTTIYMHFQEIMLNKNCQFQRLHTLWIFI